MSGNERTDMITDYHPARPPAGRITLAILTTGGIMVAAYVVAALLLAVLVATLPTLTLTGWFPWTIAMVQAIPLYAGAWLAGVLGTRIAASAPMRPGRVRVATVMALPCLLTIGLACVTARDAWFATTVTVIVVAIGTFLGAIRRRA